MNTNDIVLTNMYHNGNITEENNNMQFITKNNDYKILLSRENLIKPAWSAIQNANYKCKLEFIDNLGRNLLHLEFTELDAFVLLDNMNEFAQETCIFDQYILSGIRCAEDIHRTFNISMHTIYNETYKSEPKYIFLIEEINSYYQTVIPRISIEFNDDFLGNFMDLMFFCYLIDIYDDYV